MRELPMANSSRSISSWGECSSAFTLADERLSDDPFADSAKQRTSIFTIGSLTTSPATPLATASADPLLPQERNCAKSGGDDNECCGALPPALGNGSLPDRFPSLYDRLPAPSRAKGGGHKSVLDGPLGPHLAPPAGLPVAIHRESQRLVRVKRSNRWTNDACRRALMNEIRTFRCLGNSTPPQIVKSYDAVSEAELERGIEPWLVLEDLRGGDVLSYIERGYHLSENEVKQVTRCMLRATAFLAQRNIIHRDIKLDNIVLAENGSFGTSKLVDFGCAIRVDEWAAAHPVTDPSQTARLPEMRRIGSGNFQSPHPLPFPFHRLWNGTSSQMNSSSTQSRLQIAAPPGVFSGTPGCIAPEILKGESFDTISDVFGCGIAIFVMITNEHPFLCSTPAMTLKKNRDGCVSFHSARWGEVSHHTADLVSKMTNPEPSLRWTAEEALNHEWLLDIA